MNEETFEVTRKHYDFTRLLVTKVFGDFPECPIPNAEARVVSVETGEVARNFYAMVVHITYYTSDATCVGVYYNNSHNPGWLWIPHVRAKYVVVTKREDNAE